MKRLVTLALALLCSMGSALAAINLNTATVEQLDTLKGVGPGKAKAIVAYRDKNGPFKSIDDLKKVKGFGDKSIAKLRPELTVSGAAAPAKPKVQK